MKWRNSKERELLASGGTREQTLPTKNNPNPDLSDVGEETRTPAVVGASKDDLNLQPGDDIFQKEQEYQSRAEDDTFVGQQARTDAFSSSLASAIPAKIQIKDLTSLSTYGKTPGAYAFPYQEADGDYTDEDINVTDELGGSHNEDSEND